MLDVVVRARFVARLFAAINYVTSRRKNAVFFIGLGKNAEERIQKDATKKIINNSHKAAKRVERNVVALNG